MEPLCWLASGDCWITFAIDEVCFFCLSFCVNLLRTWHHLSCLADTSLKIVPTNPQVPFEDPYPLTTDWLVDHIVTFTRIFAVLLHRHLDLHEYNITMHVNGRHKFIEIKYAVSQLHAAVLHPLVELGNTALNRTLMWTTAVATHCTSKLMWSKRTLTSRHLHLTVRITLFPLETGINRF